MAEISSTQLLRFYEQRFGMVAAPYPSFVARNGFAPGSGTTWAREQFDLGKEKATAPVQAERNFLGFAVLMPLTIYGWKLPIEPLVRVMGGKKIVETELVGQDGSIKELIARSDYRITIAGLLLTDTPGAALPDADARRLKKLVDEPRALPVTHELLNMLGIGQVVITDDEWPEMEAQPGQQLYRLECKQDRLYSLELDPSGKFQFNAQ